MSVESTLFQLLNNKECVVIPNFGGFIVRDSPCNFTNNHKAIKPHTKTLFFNPQLTENDGLLISAISKNKSISFNHATELCNQWVIEQETKLENEKYLKWNQFGTFYLSNDNKKWFQPLADLNLDLNTFGLKTVKVNKYEPIEQTQEVINSWVPDRAEIESLDKPKSNWKAWLAAASIAMVAHFVYLNVGTVKNNQASIISTVVPSDLKVDNNNQANLPNENQENNSITNENKTNDSELITSEIPEANNEIKVESNENNATSETNSSIESISTSTSQSNTEVENIKVISKYKIELNAINHSKDLNKTGLNTYVDYINGYFQVVENIK